MLNQLAATLRAWQPSIPVDQLAGRGIVIAAGGATVFTNAYVLVSVLRRTLHCRLPIEVWHLGATEMSASMAALLEELDVSVVDAAPLISKHGDGVRDGWQLKSFAMLWSRFAEVLLLDADQVPVYDPAACFDWPQYREIGTVFWPDVVDLLGSNPVWSALGLPSRTTRSMESGQVLIDKRKCLRALAMTVRLNTAADLLYQLIYGDKDSFLLGWELAGQPFAFVPHRPFRDDRVLVQRDFSGAPLFQHRTGAKWRYGGVQHAIENFIHQAACLDALERLRQRWSGRIFHLPDRTVAARRMEAELVAQGSFELAIDQDERLVITLQRFGEIAEGRALDRENWWCEETLSGPKLVLGRPEGSTYEFQPIGGGYWTGRRLRPPIVPASLTSPATATPRAETEGLADELVRAARLEGPDPDLTALANALRLLGRVEPSVIERLRHLLPTLPAASRLALQDMLGGLEAETADRRRDIRPDSGVLLTGYTRDIDDGAG